MNKQTRNPDRETPWTMSIVEAGKRYYNVGKNQAYRLAADGTMPTIQLNGIKKALPKVIEQQLSLPTK